ncbi:hypothetical protein BST91_07430 [Nonlabens tegetincola]|uniref:hypothetical protein n=1 Tax=Nonlabens tegetincola TaxID=323273 RepID=UPI000A202005|nr:hypothetical protein [Nonlabens tegetincola]ARN71479.1 hypothetical protein BST91_07430 [Nonlabens tegetincola]
MNKVILIIGLSILSIFRTESDVRIVKLNNYNKAFIYEEYECPGAFHSCFRSISFIKKDCSKIKLKTQKREYYGSYSGMDTQTRKRFYKLKREDIVLIDFKKNYFLDYLKDSLRINLSSYSFEVPYDSVTVITNRNKKKLKRVSFNDSAYLVTSLVSLSKLNKNFLSSKENLLVQSNSDSIYAGVIMFKK